jgi:glycosyltransferase involved in cell wall biosynthesis
MLNGKTTAVVLPAYHTEETLEATVRDLTDLVDLRILVDDFSSDDTGSLARRLGQFCSLENKQGGINARHDRAVITGAVSTEAKD